MKGKIIKIICVGKIRTEWWREALAHYLKLAQKWRPVEILEVRDGDAALPQAARITQEGERLLKILPDRSSLFMLAEDGEEFSSLQFAMLLDTWQQKGNLNFVIGGPFGLDARIREKCSKTVSLSRMTWPHELARVLLVEQIYRADCILNRFPYHH